jgi:protoporphyrinogen oxidase
MKRNNFVIIGGGITGLSAAYFLVKAGKKVTVLEKNPYLGGISSSFKHSDFVLDIGPHKLYSQIPGMMDFFQNILGDDTLKVKKKNSIYIMDKYFSFPISLKNMIGNISGKTIAGALNISLGVPGTFFSKKEAKNFEEYFHKGFGKNFYHLMFEGYAKKVWGDPQKLSVELAKKRIPIESIPHLFSQIISKKEKKTSADFFYYPKNGIIEVCQKLSEYIKSNGNAIILNTEVKKITCKNKIVQEITIKQKNKLTKIKGDYLISTAHINDLADMMNLNAKDLCNNLKYSDIILVYLFMNQERALKDNWVFFPDSSVRFNRISEQKSFSEFTVPKDKTVICAEITLPPGRNIHEKEIFDMVIKDLKKSGLVKTDTIYHHIIRREKRVYPIYDLTYKENLTKIINEINKVKNMVSIGRYGLFNYNNMDHCIDMSKKVVDAILDNKEKKDWDKLTKYFDTYRIVD